MAPPTKGANKALMKDSVQIHHAPFHKLANKVSLLASGDYSDLTITCENDTYRVHKNIVCKRSGFFERAERFPVANEARKDVIDLPEDNPDLVKRLVQFLYEHDYEIDTESLYDANHLRARQTPYLYAYNFGFPHTCAPDRQCYGQNAHVCPRHTCRESCSGRCVSFTCDKCAPVLKHATEVELDRLLLHSDMYAIGDKYDVPALKNLAQERFSVCCTLLQNGELFAEVAEHVLGTTPDSDDGLREVLCRTIVLKVELLNKPPVTALLNQHTGFMFKVLRHVAEAKAGLKPEKGRRRK